MKPRPRSDYDSKELWLYYFFNDCGFSDLRVAASKKSKNGLMFTKWLNFGDLMHLESNDKVKITSRTEVSKRWFLEKISHRTIGDIEVVLDIDEPGEFSSIKAKAIEVMEKLQQNLVFPRVYFTGSKSYHIHFFVPELREYHKSFVKEWQKKVLNSLGGDMLKVSGNMIALEGALHYKSGRPKKEVEL